MQPERWPSSNDLNVLVASVLAARLPKAEWTHLAHLAVGTWHVRTYGADEALARLREAIRRLNDAHGTPNSDTEGYHETVTRAYVTLIAAFIAGSPEGSSPAECAQAVLAGPLSARDVLLRFYSAGVLMSVAARRDWVAPDQQPLPLEAWQ